MKSDLQIRHDVEEEVAREPGATASGLFACGAHGAAWVGPRVGALVDHRTVD